MVAPFYYGVAFVGDVDAIYSPGSVLSHVRIYSCEGADLSVRVGELFFLHNIIPGISFIALPHRSVHCVYVFADKIEVSPYDERIMWCGVREGPYLADRVDPFLISTATGFKVHIDDEKSVMLKG